MNRLCAAVLAALVCFSASGCNRTDHGELKRRVERIAALAAEGRLLADGVIGDRTKATFARVHARTLAEDAQHEAEKVADATVQPDLRAAQTECVRLAQALGDTIGNLDTYPGDETMAISTRRDLAKIDAEAQRLDRRITP